MSKLFAIRGNFQGEQILIYKCDKCFAYKPPCEMWTIDMKEHCAICDECMKPKCDGCGSVRRTNKIVDLEGKYYHSYTCASENSKTMIECYNCNKLIPCTREDRIGMKGWTKIIKCNECIKNPRRRPGDFYKDGDNNYNPYCRDGYNRD
jgi:hypothetical protein